MSSDVSNSPSRPPQRVDAEAQVNTDAQTGSNEVSASSDSSQPSRNVWRDWWHSQWSPREAVGFLVSLIVHLVLLVVLSLIVWVGPTTGPFTLLVAQNTGAAPVPVDEPTDAVVIEPSANRSAESLDSLMTPFDLAPETPSDIDVPMPALGNMDRDLRRMSDDWTMEITGPTGGGFSGRAAGRRGEMLAREGGTQESEAAVALALEWLAAHQFPDGGWRLAFDRGPCDGRCGDPGTKGTSTGATGLALLPFLGAGYTHMEGPYRDVVYDGLYYLKSRMIKTDHGGDLQEGTMYAQGIATIALCEAYAMTGDLELKPLAQQAVDFICYAQHSGGGWRYLPVQPGDTTVTGWQMMALKSAQMAGLTVPSPTVNLVERFLDSVQTANGAYYGYVTHGKQPGTTSVALLLRMYSGWARDDSRLVRGAAYLRSHGPSKSDMYYNYYATQVVHHLGGPAWPKWNETLREYLIKQQAQTGHERGSWHFQDRHGNVGGRLYTTAMCAMILEVYYRHMPLYGTRAVETGF
jgi:hypothetical protein